MFTTINANLKIFIECQTKVTKFPLTLKSKSLCLFRILMASLKITVIEYV